MFYEPFDGDRDTYMIDGRMTTNDYAYVNYTGMLGMMAIMMHEIGHMSSLGFQFDSESKAAYRREFGSYNGYGGSEYWYNNEAFSNDSALQANAAIGLDVSSVTTGMMGGNLDEGRGPTDWLSPSRIYADNVGQIAPPRPLDFSGVWPDLL